MRKVIIKCDLSKVDDYQDLIRFLKRSIATSTTVIDGTSYPSGYVVSLKSCGIVVINGARVISIEYSGYVFPWSGNLDQRIKKQHKKDHGKFLRVFSSQSEIISYKRVPQYIFGSQQRNIDELKSDYDLITTRQSFRMARSMAVLVTGKPGSGKSMLVTHFASQLGSYLFEYHEFGARTLRKVTEYISILRLKGNDPELDRLRYVGYGRAADTVEPYKGPICILFDEWDSLIVKKDSALEEDFSDSDLETDDGEEEKEKESTKSKLYLKQKRAKERKAMKHTITSLMDYLANQDNVICFFVSNSNLEDLDPSFTRDGRITHRLEMNSIGPDDISHFVDHVKEERGWGDTPITCPESMSIATLVQNADLSRTATEFEYNINK